jgi:LmbE family N-acetylglucosaminyl deacetylase
MGALDAAFMNDMRSVTAAGQQASARAIPEQGTPESLWNAWPGLDAVEVIPIEKWMHPTARLVVVAPHPDDEILACGGLMALHARRGGKSVVVAVTDGEASHGDARSWRGRPLAETRRAERLRGLVRLGCQDAEVHRLGLADGKVASQMDTLQSELQKVMHWGDIVVTTWRFDGHPDHEACGAAAARACAEVRCCLLEAPVWMWHWSRPADSQVPWHRLVGLQLTGEAVSRKGRAVASHASQLEPRGKTLGPVLGPTILDRQARPTEYFFA